MKIALKRIMGLLLIIILISVGLSQNFALKEVKAQEKLNKMHGDINNDDDIKEFIDNYFKDKMEKYSVPGAGVVIVKNNREVLKKGYGYSNLEEKVKVNPDKTTFPACSVSKLFTAIAIMQLYEEGKIDLDRNINDYINPYKVINNYNENVTCRNLLTHSSGVDEASELNGNTRDANLIKSQEYYMESHTPIVVRKPNTVSRYSNEGYNLLGYIVEKVSGVSYEEYIKENILKPLNMNNSLVRLKNNNTAIGYNYSDNNYSKVPLAYQYTSGSSGIISTVSDMENFIIANLNNGKFKNSSILNEETSALMKDKQFSNDENLPGMGFGFIRSNRNGQEIIKHEGGLPGYTTTLFLIPKESLGIYVATNSLNPLPFNFEEEFLNYFYPQSENAFNTTIKNLNKDYSKYEGTYRSYDGISKSNIMKIYALFEPDMKIKDNKDGTLTLHEVTSAKEEITTTLVEKEDGVFLREDGRGNFAFKLDKDGNVIYAFNDISHNSFEKIKFFEERVFNVLILAITIVTLIINIISIVRRKNKNIELPKIIKSFKLSNLIIQLFNVVGFFGNVILATIMLLNNNFNLAYSLYIFLSLLILSTLMVICNVILLIYLLVKKSGLRKEKIYYIVMTLINLAFVWFLYYFNFLGYNI